MKYKIEITETLQRVIEIEARSLSDAVVQITRDYNNGEIVLDAMDFVGFNIKEYQE